MNAYNAKIETKELNGKYYLILDGITAYGNSFETHELAIESGMRIVERAQELYEEEKRTGIPQGGFGN